MKGWPETSGVTVADNAGAASPLRMMGAALRRFARRLSGASPRVCVYTAVFAGYDEILDHVRQTVDCDFFVFSDDVSTVPVGTRGIFVTNPGGQISPVLKNVWLRLFPFEIAELKDYDLIIYLDANVRIVDPAFVAGILQHWRTARNFDLIVNAHPQRRCAYVEAAYSRQFGKYRDTDLEGQAETYRLAGFPADAGLYWNGFLVYNRSGNRARIRAFQELYWREMTAYNRAPLAHPQGQVSLPYCLWKCGVEPIVLPTLFNMKDNATPLLVVRHLRY
jgi:hypothetical protein